jgi:hypothetical protein
MKNMKMLKDLFLHEIANMYDAERRIVKALPNLVKAATCEKLKAALLAHLKEVERSFPDEMIAKNFQQREILGMKLFDCVEAICQSYHKKIKTESSHNGKSMGLAC